MLEVENKFDIMFSSFLTKLKAEWHQAGNLRVRGLNPGGSRQPLTPGCQKITSDSQPKNNVLLMNKNLQGAL